MTNSASRSSEVLANSCYPTSILETSPTPYRRLRGLRTRSVRGVSERVSPKIGVSERASGGVSPGPFGPRTPVCPKGVLRVSLECQDTFLTLRGHSQDTFWTLWGPGRDTPPDTLSDTPIFGDTLSDTPRDTSGPKAPKPPVGGWGCLKPIHSH